MSTPSERLEAEIWLESLNPDAPPDVREKFLASVDEYYDHYPTADRGPDFLAMLRDDDHAFAMILESIMSDQREAARGLTATTDTALPLH